MLDAKEPPRALGHLLRALRTDRAVGLQRLMLHSKYALFRAVGVAYRAAQEIAGAARDVGDQMACQSAGTRFSQGEGQAIRREELSDFRGKHLGPTALRRSSVHLLCHLAILRRCVRQPQRERAAFAEFAGHFDPAAVGFGDPLDNRQPQAMPAGGPTAAVRPIGALEDVRQILWR